MEKGENLNRRNLPTLQQLRYLTELEKEDNTRGMIARIAEKCQVSTAPVSRYLKSCCEKGLLTEDYRFTAYFKRTAVPFSEHRHPGSTAGSKRSGYG